MTADPLRGRMDGYVCTPFERAEEVASHAECVVHHHAYALSTGHLDYRFIVRDVERRIAEVLQIDRLCTAVHKCLQIFYEVAFCKTHLDAHVTQGDGEHCECATIEEWLCNDVVARTADVGDGEEHGRLARCSRDCSDASLKGRHSLLEYLIRGVGDACIYVARALELEKLSTIFHAVKSICSALVDRHSRTLRNRIDLLSGPHLQSLELIFLLFHV